MERNLDLEKIQGRGRDGKNIKVQAQGNYSVLSSFEPYKGAEN